MITYVRLSGFRSLQNFEMELHKGLNVLIGPNGSGKSNIISFFAFLSHAMSRSLPEAISRLGGAGSFFQKTGTETFADQVKATVIGALRSSRVGEETLAYGFRDGPIASLDYRYEFTVKASADFATISFVNEALFFRLQPPSAPVDHRRTEDPNHWEFEIQKSIDAKGVADTKLVKWQLKHAPIFFGMSPEETAENNTRLAERRNMVNQQIRAMGAADSSILMRAPSIFHPTALIRSDLSGGEILNIIPNVVKQTEDSASPPGIRGDGAGVAATLYRLAQPKVRENQMHGPFFFPPLRSTFDDRIKDKERVFLRIERFLSLINPSITKLHVANDPFDNRIKISVTIKTDSGSIELPIASMSDGTAKWLALVTAILTSGSIFAIEEPENYVHPLMQREIVDIMREATEQKDDLSLVLMTTHSETVLNAVRPDEAIVIDMPFGHTRALRPFDAAALEQLIRDTGFGLGHFYITGALTNA